MGITSKELAELCGVSRMTINRALYNTGRISAETKAMILQKAKEYDFRPDMLARGLVTGKTFYIGVVIMDSDNRYFSQMLNAIVRQARKSGYSVNITFHENSAAIEKEQLCRLVDYRVDGVILSSVCKGAAYKTFLEGLGLPLVTIDNKVAPGLPFVGIDNKKAAFEATERIVDKGYQRVVLVCPPLGDAGDDNVYVHEERRAGFCAAMQKHPAVKSEIIDSWDYTAWALSALEEDAARTAFFCTADLFALELMRFLRAQGKKVVRDYGIMGFDNVDILRYFQTPLCTVDNAVEAVAGQAVALLFAQMDHENAGESRPREILVPSLPVEGKTL